MNVCIFGAGAVGTPLGVLFAQRSDHRVTVIARGKQLAALRQRDAVVQLPHDRLEARLDVAKDIRRVPAPTIALITLNSHAIAAAASELNYLGNAGTPLTFMTIGQMRRPTSAWVRFRARLRERSSSPAGTVSR